MESIEQVFNGSGDFGKKVTATISRNGDLIHRVYLRVELPDVSIPAPSGTTSTGFRWLNWLGHILVKTVEIEIGGQRIDKHYGEWLHIWNELTQTAGRALGYANMVGNTPDLTTMQWISGTGHTSAGATGASSITIPGQIIYVPLQFWFCKNPGLALPLIALQYHEVKINLELRDKTDCYWAGTSPDSINWTTNMQAITMPSLNTSSLFVDYIYLDTEERRRFAQLSHEYLIEQLQFTGDESSNTQSNKIKLNFNHPTKVLIWTIQPDDFTDDKAITFGKQWFNYSDSDDVAMSLSSVGAGAAGGLVSVQQQTVFGVGNNPVRHAKLQLNGHDRFSERDGRYFNLVQPYQHFENVPSKGINLYSFSLKPEDHQPSGSCNMSRIDNCTLALSLTPASLTTFIVGSSLAQPRSVKIKVFAVNYNVLRIMSGMGGMAYAN
jgi:hypothetical protein